MDTTTTTHNSRSRRPGKSIGGWRGAQASLDALARSGVGTRFGAVDHPRRCRAKSQTTGERCRCVAVSGRAVCHMHGGSVGRSAASPVRAAARTVSREARAGAVPADLWRIPAFVAAYRARRRAGLVAMRLLVAWRAMQDTGDPTAWQAALEDARQAGLA